MNRMRFLTILAVFAIVLALQAIPAQAYFTSGWTKIYEGIERADGMDYAADGRVMRCYAVRVNLRNPDVATIVSPGNGTLPLDATLESTYNFVYRWGGPCKVGVNANFWVVGGSNVDVIGLVISGSNIVSNGSGNSGQYRFTQDKVLSLVFTQETPAGIWNAVCGGNELLRNGVNVATDPAINPYTCMGITQDGKQAILLVIDGRQAGWSIGCTQPEAAAWLYSFGAWNGVMMDGGGSTCMVRHDIGIVNRPCYGYSREVSTNLGIQSTAGNRIGPDCCAMNANRIDLAIRGNMNHVYLKTWTTAGGWATPVDLGGNTMEDPAICSVADGRLDVFITDATTKYFMKRTWTTAGGWTGWANWDQSLWYSGPTVCRRDATHIDLAGRSQNANHVYHNQFNTATSTWSGWVDIGVTTVYTPGICVQGNGCCCIFIRDTSTGHLLLRYGNNSTWYSWDLGGTLDGGPTAICRSGNIMDVYARGTNFQIQHRGCDNNVTWGNWESLGGSVGKIAVCFTDANTINTYSRQPDDHMWKKTWTSAGGWSGFTDQGNMFY